MIVRDADDDTRVQAIASLMRPALDYQFFQDLSTKIELRSGDERHKLERLRARLLELLSIIDQQTQVVLQRAADTLRVILNSEDIDAAIRPRLEQIDDTFMAVLQANIQAANQHDDQAHGGAAPTGAAKGAGDFAGQRAAASALYQRADVDRKSMRFPRDDR